MTSKQTVMISSTARDLPEHRQEVRDACLRQGMFPVMMEHLPASDAEAIGKSLELVDEADIYLGIFAHRYGYVPQGHDISITEMEYNRAVKRGMPRLIFIIDKTHSLSDFTIDDIETGEGAVKLKTFKERVEKENIVNFFKSPADLRADAINSLSKLREPDLTQFHYVSDIPQPPEAYVAHPYTLLQTHQLIGRQAELNLLTDWVTRPKQTPGVLETPGVWEARILNIVAIGGMGKSALTWTWFNDIAPQEMKPLAGRMWWSFYESDASFENFVSRALAYVTQRSREAVQQLAPPDREDQLLAALDREPFLLVLDGLERILIAYARMDAARLADEELPTADDRPLTADSSLRWGLPSAVGGLRSRSEHLLRKAADPRAGAFLRKLAHVRAARILVSTRLYPADLQTAAGGPLPGCSAVFLPGLGDDDALNLWRTFGVSGSRETLLPLFHSFEKHPLLLQSLASEVANYRYAPGDFERWQKDYPAFNSFKLPLVQARTHVLEYALTGLEDKARHVLQTIAAFRMPTNYDTLVALFVTSPLPLGEGQGEGRVGVCPDERDLDRVLADLEDRGLVGWDKRANRYDLHPIVRGVVWSGLPADTRSGVFTSLQLHFEAIPKIKDYLQVNSLEDLTPAIELYNTLIGLGRYDDAYVVFRDRISKATLYRLSASRQRAELLEMLFPDGLDQLPRLNKPDDQAFTLNALALAYQFSGQPGRAAPLFRLDIEIYIREDDKKNASVVLGNLSNALRLAGALRESEVAACRALVITREQSDRFQEAISLYWLGLTLEARGVVQESRLALRRSSQIFTMKNDYDGFAVSYLAQCELWSSAYVNADQLANRAWASATRSGQYESGLILAARLQGTAALGLNNFAKADERLHHALTRARAVNQVQEELPALVALAELRRRQGDLKAARDLLDDLWELAERGPYPLFHADAFNVLAQIERAAGNNAAAVEAATQAYQLAWCDGPPFAYHWGLAAARQHLADLGTPEPSLPPFDDSQFEPMPEVELDPEDEFHVGEEGGEAA